MVKKLLFIFFLVINFCSFSQEKSVDKLMATPNPFSTSTVISFESTQEQGVFLTVKNVLGKVVFRKAYYAQKGKKEIRFENKNLKSGMYIYAIETNKNVISKRFVVK